MDIIALKAVPHVINSRALTDEKPCINKAIHMLLMHGYVILLPLRDVYISVGVVGSGSGVVYLTSPGRPTEIGLQLGKACYPCSR